MDKEQLISTQTIYQGKILDLHRDLVRLPSGKESTREVVHHRGAVAILPYTQGGILLVRQYRYAVNRFLWEIPAGLRERGETIIQTAQRELVEEIGYFPGKLEKLVEFYSTPGFSDEQIHVFLATQLTGDTSKQADFDEFIEVQWFSREQIGNMIADKQIEDAKTLLAINYAILHHRIN